MLLALAASDVTAWLVPSIITKLLDAGATT